ncbi:unnamed protein product [Rotaria socialis]|uniref:Dynein light chain n=1 Tax=Rotaria socialis TaxID=392032 RepID=A0A817XSI9_9BILA|nr:unnamed protein product [Rotaria socialis]CAF3339705.1 unnamed protein product [Rotaria socialis]CAF3343418.1 unnamed protein product [Rotaria socialis]CAF3371706.1 unnamed protein product [Rotaria socialis]CAF3375423.1 unnamed protein product [Rotaria socialis]
MAAEGGEAETQQKEETKRHTYPLVRTSDMNDELKTECMELCVTACEKFSQNNESAARMIKETMDKKFGPTWQCIVGEGFGYHIEHEVKSLLYMFFGGTTAIIVWKCA